VSQRVRQTVSQLLFFHKTGVTNCFHAKIDQQAPSGVHFHKYWLTSRLIVLQQTLVYCNYCLTFWKFKSIHACSVTTRIDSVYLNADILLLLRMLFSFFPSLFIYLFISLFLFHLPTETALASSARKQARSTWNVQNAHWSQYAF